MENSVRTKEHAMSEMICPQCEKSFRQGKHNQRFCTPQCKDDFHNAEKMFAYRQRKLAEVEEAEERREALSEIVERMKSKPEATANGATGNHKPLSEIIEALKPETLPKLSEQSLKRRAW
jgi:hypothetical protein